MVKTIFERISTASSDLEFVVKISMVEIYMERIRDLIDPSRTNLKVHEDKASGSIYIAGASETYVASEEEVLELMRTGNENRAIGITDMNNQSSRSHSIFILTIT